MPSGCKKISESLKIVDDEHDDYVVDDVILDGQADVTQGAADLADRLAPKPGDPTVSVADLDAPPGPRADPGRPERAGDTAGRP